MLVEELRTLPDSLVGRLDPIRVQQHVRGTGWRHRALAGNGHVALYERPESRREQLLIPLSHELADFTPRMAEVVAYLAKYEKRPAAEVLADLLLPESDVLRFQESSPAAVAGDVPFEHGLALLQGTRKTLLAAACSAIRPAAFHPRMSLADADQFLSRCRLGQTERGSYVLTVACPLDAGPQQAELFDNALPLTRRVTVLLMRSLHRLASALDLGDPDSVLRQADAEDAEGEPVLSANLCEGLLEMAPDGEDSFLRISADFSHSLPLPEVGPPTTVRLRREVFPRIEYLATRLRPASSPRPQLLVGFVETLNGRANSDSRLEGQVILRLLTPESESVRARIDLSVEAYELANQAHMSNRPVSLEGILHPSGRLSRIERAANFQILRQPPSGSEGAR